MVNLWTPIWRLLFESRICFSIYVAVYARRVMVPGGSKFHLATGKIYCARTLGNLTRRVLLQNCHRLMLSHLPSLDPSINRAAGTRISETVGEVAVELRETRLEKKRVREQI